MPEVRSIPTPDEIDALSATVVLKISQAARLGGFAESTLYKLVQSGEVPSVRIGGSIRIPTAQFLQRLGAVHAAA